MEKSKPLANPFAVVDNTDHKVRAVRLLFAGPSRSGKTKTATDLVGYALKVFPKLEIILISRTAYNCSNWRHLIKSHKKKINIKYFREASKDCYQYIKKRLNDPRRKHFLMLFIDDQGSSPQIKLTTKFNPIKEVAISAYQSRCFLFYVIQSLKYHFNDLDINVEQVYSKRLITFEERTDFRKLFMGNYTEEEAEQVYAEAWQNPYDELIIDKTVPCEMRCYRRQFSKSGKVVITPIIVKSVN